MNALRHRCRHGATGIRPSTHPCVYCLLGFETLKDLEFRNREGEFKRETTSALNRRSRGNPRRFCPAGMHSRRLLIARLGVRTRANRSGRKRGPSQLHDLWESRLRLLIKDLRFCKLHASHLRWRLSYYRFKAKGSSLDYLQAPPLSSSSPISVLPCGKRR